MIAEMKKAEGKQKTMIYIASPFFNEEELKNVRDTEKVLTERGYEIYSPRLHDDQEHAFQSPEWNTATFRLDLQGIDASDAVLVLFYGNYSDTGTAWECGYAYAKGKPVILVHMGEVSNLMMQESARANIRMEDLKTYDFDKLERAEYKGKQL